MDYRFIRENIDSVEKNIVSRGMVGNPRRVTELYNQRNILIQETDDLRRQRNEGVAKMKGPVDPEIREALITQGKTLKERLASKELALEVLAKELQEEASKIPNMTHPDVPVGKEDRENREILRWGEVPSFSFSPKDHVELGESLDIIDFERATRVSGAKFYYLKNEAVLLEMALVRYALDRLQAQGFILCSTPDIVREEVAAHIGFLPRGEESNIYTLEGTGTCLVGTAEIPLGGYYSGEIIDLTQGPILLGGLSHCFRREAGGAGQYSRGLYRVHQFTKVEMFAFCKPQDSDALLLKIRAIEEELFQGLGLPFRVVDVCTGDLGAPAYRKFDLEAWMPGRGERGDWGEVTSASNCTDYQARRLGIRYRDGEGKNRYVHTLNGTAIAVSRALVAILENYQQADGSVRIPPVLIPYIGLESIRR